MSAEPGTAGAARREQGLALREHANAIVSVQEPERMNLLGLLMRGLLAANLEVPALRRRALGLRGAIAVRAGEMRVTLHFGADGVHIASGGDKANARVSGDMKSLLGVVTGAGLVRPLLSGRVRIGGNPWLLLRVLPLITARTPVALPAPAAHRAAVAP